MTDQEMRIAIAEACGYTGIRYDWINGSDAIKDWMHDKGRGLPDYPNDLNAMHQAWLSMGKIHQKAAFYCRLKEIVERENPDINLGISDFVNATARQRAEAFLRVIGKWSE